LDLENEVHEVGPRIAFDLELDRVAERRQTRGDRPHIVAGDVTFVGPGMHRDAGRAGRQACVDGVDHARHLTAARIAKRRDLVDVDAETNAYHLPLTAAAISSAQARMS